MEKVGDSIELTEVECEKFPSYLLRGFGVGNFRLTIMN